MEFDMSNLFLAQFEPHSWTVTMIRPQLAHQFNELGYWNMRLGK